MEQSRERSSALLIHLGVVAIEKGAFWSPLTKGRQLYLLYLYRLIQPQYLISLLSFANIFWFISSSLIIRFVCGCCCFFWGGGVISFRWVVCVLLSLAVSLVVAVSLFVLLAPFSIQFFIYFCSYSFWGYWLYHWLVLLMA